VTTGVGGGIAIPHGRCAGVHDCAIAIGVSKNGVDFGSMDGLPVHVIFLLAVQQAPGFPYARLLARVMQFLNNELTRKRIINSQRPSEIIALLEEFDRQPGMQEFAVKH